MKKILVIAIGIAISIAGCTPKETSGEADMLHGCFKDSHIHSLNQALDLVDELLEDYYQAKSTAENYMAFVKAISDRENTNSPLYDKNLKKIILRMRDNRSFYEIFTSYDLQYMSHSAAADQGVFSVYMLDNEKPFFKCWMNKLENPLIKSYLNHYLETNYIDLNANIWYEIDNMNVMMETSDFENPEVRMYVGVFSLMHLAFMVNPEMMKGLE